MCRLSILIQLLLFLCGLLEFAHSLASGAGRAFYEKPKQVEKPRLIVSYHHLLHTLIVYLFLLDTST